MLAAQVIKGYVGRTRYPMWQLTDENIDTEKVLYGPKPLKSSIRVQIEKGVKVLSVVLLLLGLVSVVAQLMPNCTTTARDTVNSITSTVLDNLPDLQTLGTWSFIIGCLHLAHSGFYGCIFFRSGFYEQCLVIVNVEILFVVMQGFSTLCAIYSLVWFFSLCYMPAELLADELNARFPILLILVIEILTAVFIFAATSWYRGTSEFAALVAERGFPTGVKGVPGVIVEAIMFVLLLPSAIWFAIVDIASPISAQEPTPSAWARAEQAWAPITGRINHPHQVKLAKRLP